MPHERAVATRFILPNRVDRYLGLLETAKGRDKFRLALPHFNDFDPRFIGPIPSDKQKPDQIEQLLKGLGAPEICHAFSEWDEIDGLEMNLGDALRRIVGYQMGTILSCVPGKIAYFEGEGKGRRFLLYGVDNRK